MNTNIHRMSTPVGSNKKEIPLVGITTWKGDPNLKLTVREALNAGCRYFKCSTHSDFHRVGEALVAAMEEGIVTREELRVAGELNELTIADVESHIRVALSTLQLEYFDVLIIRCPAEITSDFLGLWRKVEDLSLKGKGLVVSMGVGGATPQQIQELCSSVDIPPFVCETEMHPLFRQTELLNYCREQNIHCTARAPFAAGEITEPYCHERLSHDHNLLKSETVLSVAIPLDKTPAQVLVRWELQRGTSVLLPTINHDRLRENFDVWDWELSTEQIELLNAIEIQTRILVD